MNITRENVDQLNAIVRINLDPSDYKDRVDTILRSHRQKASMPGFRPGKVPAGMIRKMYYKPVLMEEINKIVNENLFNWLQEEKIDILGNPMPNEDGPAINLDEENFELAFDLGLAPAFEVAVSDKDKVTAYKITPDESLVEKQINDLAKRHGKVEPAEESGESSMLFGDLNELDEEGEIKAGGIFHSGSIFVEFTEDADAKKALLGLKAGAVITVDPQKVSRNERDLGHMLGIEPADAANVTAPFRFELKSISNMQPAELNQDLFDKVAGEGNVSSEEEFRAHVAADLTDMLAGESTAKLDNDLVEYLLDKFKLELPDAFLKRWMATSGEKAIEPEVIEKDYPNYAKALRWQLIENKLIEQFELKAEYDDLVAYTKELLRANLAQYGQQDVEDDYLTSSAQNILQNQDEARKITERLYGERVMGALKDTVKLKEKEVSYDEFVNLASDKPAKSNLLSSLIGS